MLMAKIQNDMVDLQSFSSLSVHQRVQALEQQSFQNVLASPELSQKYQNEEIENRNISKNSTEDSKEALNVDVTSNLDAENIISRPPPLTIYKNKYTGYQFNLSSPLEYSSSDNSELAWSPTFSEEEKPSISERIGEDNSENRHIHNFSDQFDELILVENESSNNFLENVDEIHQCDFKFDDTIDINDWRCKPDSKINLKNAKGESPLSIATFRRSFEVIKALVERGADVNSCDVNGNLPIHWVVCRDVQNKGYDENKHHKCLNYLLKHGADVNIQNNSGQSALHVAAEAGCEDCIHILLHNGGLSCIKDNNGNTPLHLSVNRNTFSCIEKILSNPCGFDCINCNENKALFAGFNSPNAFNRVSLGKSGCTNYDKNIPYSYNSEGDVQFQSNILTTSKQNFESCDQVREMNNHEILDPTHSNRSMAIWDRFFENALVQDSGIMYVAKYPFHNACENGHIDNILRMIDDGTDIDAQDDMGNTPLHLATKECHTQVVEALLQSGSITNLKNNVGETPMSISIDNGCVSCTKLLRDYDPKHAKPFKFEVELKEKEIGTTEECIGIVSSGDVGKITQKQKKSMGNDNSGKDLAQSVPKSHSDSKINGWAYGYYRPMKMPSDLAVAIESAKMMYCNKTST